MDTRARRLGLAALRSRAGAPRALTDALLLASALAAGSSSAGCLEAVSLGSQCPERFERCDQIFAGPPDPLDAGPGGPSMPGTGSLDAGTIDVRPGQDASMDASVVDANDGASVDAAPDGSGSALDAGPLDSGVAPQFPALRNGSFELTRGRPGEIAYSPIDPIPLGTNLIEPWGACRSGFSARESSDGVLPRDGAVFVEADLTFIGVSGLRQTLTTPMRGGTRYGFAIDLRASPGAELALQVSASQVDCVAGVPLADTGTVSDRDWQRVCISFVPLIDTPQLLLQPVARGLTANGRLYFDNLRYDPSCVY